MDTPDPSSRLRPLIREAFRPCPDRWLSADVLFSAVMSLPETKAAAAELPVSLAHFAAAAAWNVERGHLIRRENEESSAEEYRLTPQGRRTLFP